MKLGAYLDENRIRQHAFAVKIGRTQGRVSQLVGGAKPSFDELVSIRTATDGAVTAEDFFEQRAGMAAE